jgi:DNA-directed RNA polymerase specialized sigma24 family protein
MSRAHREPTPAHRAMPDEQLMLAYARGDSGAFDELYARHEGALFRFVRRLLGASLAAQADEVFQETWLRIIAARAGFAPHSWWRT